MCQHPLNKVFCIDFGRVFFIQMCATLLPCEQGANGCRGHTRSWGGTRWRRGIAEAATTRRIERIDMAD
jgi:hypothetical protein